MEQSRTTEEDLLGRYAFDGSGSAFSRLVERYMKLVYSTCYRELRQHELAQEATQAVFITLAQKARTLRSETGLASWLYKTAQFKAGNLRKQERRRMMMERQAIEQAWHRYERSEDEAWGTIEPALNDAINALAASDRELILLRFFEEMSLREVGQELGLSDNAAQKRLVRALEKLRSALVSRQAAAVSIAALSALLSARATYAVPAHMATSIAQSAAIAMGHAPSLPPPVSGGVAQQCRGGSPAGSAFHSLNLTLGKGILLVSTTKIIAGAAAAVVLILALALVVVHRLHQAPTGTWVTVQTSDATTKRAAQQMQADFRQFGSALASGDLNSANALVSPTSPMHDHLVVLKHGPNPEGPDPRAIWRLPWNVTAIDISGKFARAKFSAEPVSQSTVTDTFENSGGRWLLITSHFHEVLQ